MHHFLPLHTPRPLPPSLAGQSTLFTFTHSSHHLYTSAPTNIYTLPHNTAHNHSITPSHHHPPKLTLKHPLSLTPATLILTRTTHSHLKSIRNHLTTLSKQQTPSSPRLPHTTAHNHSITPSHTLPNCFQLFISTSNSPPLNQITNRCNY